MVQELPLSMLFPLDNRLSQFQKSLPSLTAKQRKAIVTLCRAQYVPTRTESKILAYQCFDSYVGVDMQPNCAFAKLVKLVAPFIHSPIYSGLVLDLARSCEPSKEETEALSDASWFKEVLACNTERRPSSLNYNAIFVRERFMESLIPDVEPRPEVNAYIHNLLVEWREKLQLQTVYPRMSSKAASRHSRRLGDQIMPLWKFDRTIVEPETEIFNQRVMEKIYAETGNQVGGMCEMRQKLYRAGITPRTYFAQGGDAYFSSRFLQDPCSKLVDILPTSNHVLRLIPSNLRLDDSSQHVFIYDLKSFTSLFTEFLPFIRCLAEFCRGYEVKVWDAREGEMTCDLGELWDQYADMNANAPPYSPERWNKQEEPFYHMCAGFLGVYGNLMLCTFLHAVVVLSIVGDVQKCYTAGDDGGAVLVALLVLEWGSRRGEAPKRGNSVYDDVYVLFYALSLLGIIQWSKVFTTQESGAIALKRPLRQVEGMLYSPTMIIWPQSILITMFKNWHSRHDHRFHTYYMFNSRADCRKAIITETTRFLGNVAALQHRFEDGDLEVVKKYCEWIYQVIGAPVEGVVPQFSSLTYADQFVATIDKPLESFRNEPIRDTIRRLWHGEAIIPVREWEGDYAEEEVCLMVGAEFVARKTKLLGWLCKLGYCEDVTLTRRVSDEPGFNLLLREYLRPYSERLPAQLYKFRINRLPPVLM